MAVGAIAAAVTATAASAPATHPNVLFIVVDDLNTALGCYGNTTVKSPNIDRLAARGVRFDRAYCQYPLCNPSRASFLSGRRPEATGIYVLTTSARAALPGAIMLPQFFRRQGYFTAGAGKVFHSQRMNDPESWDFYADEKSVDPEELAALDARYGGGDGRPSAHVLTSDGARTRDGINVRTILRLMGEQAAAGRPFFLAPGFHKPHLPWTAPKKFFELYSAGSLRLAAEPALEGVPAIALQTELSGFPQPDSRVEAIRGYYACISFTDAHVGMLLDELDRRSLWPSTVVVLVGDNGFHLGDHGGLWAKLSAFDASTRVPLIMAGVGVPAGRVVSAPVELVDIYPTLADLGGFEIPTSLDGQSLVSLMRGGTPARTRPAASLVYHYDAARKTDVAGRTVISQQWRYTEWDGGKAGRELYLRSDHVGEYRNRIEDVRAADLVRQGEGFLRSTPPPKPGPANRPRALLADDQKGKTK